MKLITVESRKSYAVHRPLYIKFTLGNLPEGCEEPSYSSKHMAQTIRAFVLHYRKDKKGIYRLEDEIIPVSFAEEDLIGYGLGGRAEASIEKERYPVVRVHTVAERTYRIENVLLVYPSLKLGNREAGGQLLDYYIYNLGYGGKNPECLPVFQESFSILDREYPWLK